ncbi:MAG: isoprenyl transferase [Nitrospinota bacterium]|nr:MAG: isoprenyl transferase [Nitrospinota bacterium]
MDGNGRWAQQRALPRNAGHREGVKSVDDIVTTCRKLGIPALTLYALSTENWSRPRMEVRALMRILREYLRKELHRMLRENIRFNTIGRISDFPETIQTLISEAREKTKQNNGMILTLALSYGARTEIVDAVRRVAQDVQQGLITPEQIDAHLFSNYLYTAGLPDPDLLIRTSGELRISNFLLWQLAYTELYFTPVYWPDFRGNDLLRAIIAFQKRERRFGLTQEQCWEKG